MEFISELSDHHIEVCRVCLNMDVKMFHLQAYPLESCFEAIIGIPVTSTMELPPYLCYECAAYVKKFSFFKERCLKGQSILYSILQNSGMLTEIEIRQADRTKLHLDSTLTICNNGIDENLYSSDDEIDKQKIKEEPTVIIENDIEVTIDVGCVKEEHDFDYTATDLPSSDDEPLSIHKTNKETKKVKKRGRKKKEEVLEEKKEIIDFEDFPQEPSIADAVVVVAPEPQKEERKARAQKTKAPFKRRTKNTGGVDTDDVNLDDYVTVIILTLEEQLAEIEKRKESSNYLNAVYQCQLCYKGFIDTNAWNHHQTKHHPSSGEVECAVCRFRFPSRRALQKHSINHEKKYACRSCNYISKTTTQAKQHQRWHKGVTYSCEYCEEVSTKWTSYLSHVRMKHPSQHICNVCGYSFVSQLGLTMHRTMMHKEQEKPTEPKEPGPYCKECDVKFTSEEAYNRHMVNSVKHSETNNFSKGCRVCGATFSTTEELRVHHRKEHARTRPKNYGKKKADEVWPANCVHCGELIENAREQWTHFRRAHPDKAYPIRKDYVCDICGKSFRGNAFLTYHKRTHGAERQFPCGTCGKAFYNRTNLNVHARTHSDARPYPCDVCGKAFKCKGALDRHYRSHTGVRPYECEVCGKAFGQSNSRKLHVRTVHLKQPAPYAPRPRPDCRRKLTKPPAAHAFVYCNIP